ncbi:hypothetical protein AAVH_03247 [Aphelenchoides avenae]|nr:hypothetical protein AAVH_03247 [Aphelenchus avenae]
MLAVRSGYFRRLLSDASTAETQAGAHSLEDPVEIVAPLITYIQTDTFGIEPDMPLNRVLKMVQLIDKLDPSEPEKLKNGIANYLHYRFEGAKNNVHDVALIAAISLLLPFERLAICALKLIANDHYVAFTEHYSDMVADPTHQEVYRILAIDRENDLYSLRFSHDEHLLFPDDNGTFRPLAYVHGVRKASFSTRLIWSQD